MHSAGAGGQETEPVPIDWRPGDEGNDSGAAPSTPQPAGASASASSTADEAINAAASSGRTVIEATPTSRDREEIGRSE